MQRYVHQSSYALGKNILILVKGHGDAMFVDVIDNVHLSPEGKMVIVGHSLWAFDTKVLEN